MKIIVSVQFSFRLTLSGPEMGQPCKVVHDLPELLTPSSLKAQSSAHLDTVFE